MKIVCSINSYEPLILETKTSQSSLSLQELQTFVKSQRFGKYSNMHWKGKLALVFLPIQITIGWIGVKTEYVVKQRNYIKDKCFRKKRKGL